MAIRIVRLGSPRSDNEGLRIGAVRWPPRGVPKAEIAGRDFYDVWYPNLAPSEALLKSARADLGEAAWRSFQRRFFKEMKTPQARHDLSLLAALSHQTHFSLGCYCADETRCHRSLLKYLLIQLDALVH